MQIPLPGRHAAGVQCQGEAFLAVPDRRSGPLEIVDIHEGHHEAADLPGGVPVGMDAADEPTAGGRADLVFHGAGRDVIRFRQGRHLGGTVSDVGQRPAQVAGDEVVDVHDGRCELLDPPLAVQEYRGNPRAGEQVLEVAVGVSECRVGRLDLLARGLELLVGRLELLIHGDELFVGRLQLLVGRLDVLDRPLEVSPGVLEILLEAFDQRVGLLIDPLQDRLAGIRLEAEVLEDDQEEPAGFAEVRHRLDGQADPLGPFLDPDDGLLVLHRPPGLDSLRERRREATSEGPSPASLTMWLWNAPRQFPGISPSPDAHTICPSSRTTTALGGELVEDDPLHQERQVAGRRDAAAAPVRGDPGLVGPAGRGRPDRGRQPTGDPVLGIRRPEEFLVVRHALRRAEEQIPARPERVMEQGDELLLEVRPQVDQQVPARDQVEAGERRVVDQVVEREQAELPDFLRDRESSPHRLERCRSRSGVRSSAIEAG